MVYSYKVDHKIFSYIYKLVMSQSDSTQVLNAFLGAINSTIRSTCSILQPPMCFSLIGPSLGTAFGNVQTQQMQSLAQTYNLTPGSPAYNNVQSAVINVSNTILNSYNSRCGTISRGIGLLQIQAF